MIKMQTWMIGPALSLMAAYIQYRRRDVARWMKERRIDGRKKKDMCEFCGEPLKRPEKFRSPKGEILARTCSRYPNCRYVRWETPKTN
jgi:hypothetical protein